MNYSKICNLIYSEKTEEACIIALDLLSKPASGIDEALRYLYMRDASYRLGEKENAIKYGCLMRRCLKDFFDDKKILSTHGLNSLCTIIKNKLECIGTCDISIDIRVKEDKTIFKITLCRDKFCTDILISDLEREFDSKINNRIRDERYLYYRAVANEISDSIKQLVPSNLYGNVVIHTNRVV